MAIQHAKAGATRRKILQCMAWGSAGVLWTMGGGVPRARALEPASALQPGSVPADGFSFVQISDTHIGFTKDPNPAPDATLRAALSGIAAQRTRPAFMVHTGDVSHLSRASEFDAADQIIKTAGLETFYVPGEHDTINDDGRAFFDRFGHDRNTRGWYSFDHSGVHFIALVNVLDLKAGGLGYLGGDQIAWLRANLERRAASTPIVVFAHMPLWPLYPDWGWGTDDAAQALSSLKRFGSVTVLNGHIHQVIQKIEGTVSFRTAMSTAYPQPGPGLGPGPGPMPVSAAALRSVLGVRRVDFASAQPTITDTSLAG